MKLWIDDVRPAPDGWVWAHSVYGAIKRIELSRGSKDGDFWIFEPDPIEIISIDHDAGDYFQYGGDYIKVLDWLEEQGYNYPIHIHSMNPVGIQNMRNIIVKNGWHEIL